MDIALSGSVRALLYPCENTGPEPLPLVVLHTGEGESVEIAGLLKKERLHLLVIEAQEDPAGFCWNRDLSPWPAPRAFHGGKDLEGRAEAWLAELKSEILPAAEQLLPALPCCRMAAGYSLAGLFAVWALVRSDLFCAAASMSGSLWYDGFCDYLLSHPFNAEHRPQRLVLTLGDREKLARNPRLAAVESCTRTVQRLFAEQGVPVSFELVPGGHFERPAERTADGIRRLVSPAALE